MEKKKRERYFELLNKESKLTALENAGVDNWSGYSEAMEDHDENGKILAKEVSNSKGLMLLSEGTVLKKEHIDKLAENNISEVYIVDSQEDEAAINFCIDNIEEDSVDIIKDVIDSKANISDDKEKDKIIQITKGIIDDILTNPQITEQIINVKRGNNDIYTHLLNTAVLSVVMAVKIGFEEEKLHDIALGALLHDIGIVDVKTYYMDTDVDRLPADEKFDYRKHVFYGYEKVKLCDWMTEITKNIILGHHEKVNGTGYPFHKRGKDIGEEVMLVAICDTFDEMIKGIGYEQKKIHEVIEYLRTVAAYSFDYDMLIKVLSNIAWFPNGSKVITNENEVGIIIKQNKGLADRPIIKIIRDSSGNDLKDGPVKNLLECLTVFIVDTTDEEI